MAVYTDIADEELDAFLAPYGLGELVAFKGIAEGVSNSNFFLQTEQGRFILTIYESRAPREDLPFFIGLMDHLAQHGFSAPQPIRRADGGALGEIAGKPAAIVSFLEGISVRKPTAAHCFEAGRIMAELHQAGAGFAMVRPNPLSVTGWRPLMEQAGARADRIQPGLAARLTEEVAFHETHWPKGLPGGVIHADMFPDNTFFLHGKASGVIDFYFAANDALAFDLAIGLNAWCFEPDASFNRTKGQALIAGYESVRRLDDAEVAALPLLARGAALRFLLTRTVDWLDVPAGALVKPHDPIPYDRRLFFHRTIREAREYGLQR